MTNTIHLEHITKTIKQQSILEDISLTLEAGKVYGFVGENGSGKTMLLRTISGLIHPTSGEVWINNQVLHKDISVVPNLGIMLENTGLYTEFTGFWNLKLLAGIQKKITDEEIREAIRKVGLNPDDQRSIRKYSLGMRQRILLAQAIMEKPQYLLLDEPGNGLDEEGVELLRTIIRTEREKGTLILLASHSKEDIRLLCDKVYRVKKGRVTAE